MKVADDDHDSRLAMYAVRGAPLWRPLRLIAAWGTLVWGLILLGSVGWPEWLAGLFIASAAYTLGAME